MTTETVPATLESSIETLHDGLKRGLEAIVGSTAKFTVLAAPAAADAGHCASIAFTGDIAFVIGVAVPRSVGPTLARCFTGVAIAADTEALADVVAEIVNVIAGDVIERLERADVQVRMGLPRVRPTTDVSDLGRPLRAWSVASDVGEVRIVVLATPETT